MDEINMQILSKILKSEESKKEIKINKKVKSKCEEIASKNPLILA